jgi:small subunit ribosomal protein S18
VFAADERASSPTGPGDAARQCRPERQVRWSALTTAENPCQPDRQPEEHHIVPPPPRRTPKRKVNPLHAKRIVDVDWKDVTLLRTFISDRGKIRARRVTGLTPQQQRRVAVAIRNAREMALLPYPRAGRG